MAVLAGDVEKRASLIFKEDVQAFEVELVLTHGAAAVHLDELRLRCLEVSSVEIVDEIIADH